jgi:hypothetical protein
MDTMLRKLTVWTENWPPAPQKETIASLEAIAVYVRLHKRSHDDRLPSPSTKSHGRTSVRPLASPNPTLAKSTSPGSDLPIKQSPMSCDQSSGTEEAATKSVVVRVPETIVAVGEAVEGCRGVDAYLRGMLG